MWKCEQCGQEIEDQFDLCWECSADGLAPEDREAAPAPSSSEQPGPTQKKARGPVAKVISFVLVLVGMGLFWNTLFMMIAGVVAVGSRYLDSAEVFGTGLVMLLGLGLVFVGKLIYDKLLMFVGAASVLYTGLLFFNRSMFRELGEEGRIPKIFADALLETSLPMAVVILLLGIGMLAYSRLRKPSA